MLVQHPLAGNYVWNLCLWQALAQECESPLFSEHSSTLCGVTTQLLHLHDLLHSRASMQGLLVVMLACLDSRLWLDCLVSNAAVLEAVFEVLVNQSGFEEEAAAEEALQAQEAAWAVLAAVSRRVDTADTAMQVSCTSRVCCALVTVGCGRGARGVSACGVSGVWGWTAPQQLRSSI